MAIRQPLDIDTITTPKGRVFIIPNRCKGCKFCIEFCPQKVLVESKNINPKGYHYPVVSDGKEEACTHCEFCSIVCPEMAIYTEELTKNHVRE